MVSFTLLVAVALSALQKGLAAPSAPITDVALAPRGYVESRQSGSNTYTFWSEGGGTFNCNNQGSGKYSCNWNGQAGGGFVAGTGYKPGGNRAIKYSGTYKPKGPGYLALYGWTRNPLIEYYVVESYDVLAPGEPWTKKGNFSAGDEGNYDLYTSQRVNKPSIDGTRTFMQFWSVRTEKRVGGTLTTGKHFDAWSKAGMKLGSSNEYMVILTEGFANGNNLPSGSSSIQVS